MLVADSKLLTKEILIKEGFESDNPDFVLSKWRKYNGDTPKSPKWNITIRSEYIPGSNELGYNVSTWKSDNSNTIIIKHCQAGIIKTCEELNRILDVCEIPYAIDEATL